MNDKTSHRGDSSASILNDDAHLGLAGRTARFFIQSPLSPLLFGAMMLMGIIGLVLAPRQEDPQISVPMIDIFVQYPGASASQVANLAIRPLERMMSEIPDIKHVYSASQRGMGMVTVQFEVGQEMGPSLIKVNDKLDSNMNLIPPGVMPPLVQAKGIDDVPVVNITLWSKDLDGDGKPDVDDGQLRMLAHDVLQALKEIPNTGSSFIVGGRAEQVRVEVIPERLSGHQISLDQIAQTIQTANAEQVAGGIEAGDAHFSVVTGSFLRTVEDISRLVVGTHQGAPVYIHDVARVVQGPEDAHQFVAYYTGPAGPPELRADAAPAVTIAIAKKPGTNGVTVANAILDRVESLQRTRIPSNVEVSITRNYGETANDKVSELIFKLFIATGFVFLLVLAAFRAFRPAIVVVLVIPVVLLFTIFTAYIAGYTIDRVSLFALIFSIGILVDDAIVVVENIYRRWLEEGRTDVETAVDAVREVGNPTILATFTVIGALLPMGFVSGMMGPYMEPIPALGSVAMLVSLFAAFVFTPWLSISPWLRPSMTYLQDAEKREHEGAERMEAWYRKILTPMIESPAKARLFNLVMWGTFLLMCSMFYFQLVAVKMLPLDNKPEFSVVLDMPEGSALPVTVNTAHQIAERLRNNIPEITAVQVYAGTAKPFDFNGMVRHYYLREQPWEAEIQVQLLHKRDRKRSSHEIAVDARKMLQDIVQRAGATIAVVEMPPGPPVLQSVVAEVHGPDAETRRQVAQDLTEIFKQAESLRDVDNYLRGSFDYWRFKVDTEKAVRRGISVDVINRNLAMALGGVPLGDVKQRAGHEPVNILMQVPLAERAQITRLGDLPIMAQNGAMVPLRELGHFERLQEEEVIYHKDLRPIEYVVAEVGGRLAAPVYGMFQVQNLVREQNYTAPDGIALGEGGMFGDAFYWFSPPPFDGGTAIEWTGEWTVTFETFRDMGGAFIVALVLIYMLVVWEFGNFRIPALIMAPIPLTLLGIIPAHMFAFHMGWGGEFTATSMIGWIALAGIIVRNSILLVDFSIHEIQRGIPVAEAVIRSCKVRTRPIVITALALVCGSSVIFFDPIFQGMAISLASGVIVSTLLTLIVIPLGCIKASKSLYEVAAIGAGPGFTIPDEQTPPPPAAAAPTHTTRGSSGRSAGLLMTLWGAIFALFSFLFYAIRGIIRLLMQAFNRKGPPNPPPSGGAGGSEKGGSGGGSGSDGGTPGAAASDSPAATTGDAPPPPPAAQGRAAPASEPVTTPPPAPVPPPPVEESPPSSAVTAPAPPPPVEESPPSSAAPAPAPPPPIEEESPPSSSAAPAPAPPLKSSDGQTATVEPEEGTSPPSDKPKESGTEESESSGASHRRGIRLKKNQDDDFQL